MVESGMTPKMAETAAERQGYASPRRQMLRGLATVALGGLLAACQVVPKTQGPPPPPPENPDAIEPGLPTDTDRHRVALLVPETGTNADVGTAIANATTLALLDTKADKLRITTYDTALGTAIGSAHTSELQSLMRISYAVFCLKKKQTQNRQHKHPITKP